MVVPGCGLFRYEREQHQLRRVEKLANAYRDLRDEPLELFRDDYRSHSGGAPCRPQVRYKVHGQYGKRRRLDGELRHGDNGLLFLLSEFEVFGSISYGNTNEKNKQAQYAYYSAGNSKIKYKHNGTSTAAIWWLRSPGASDSYRFVSVDADGTVNDDHANYSLGFAPGFYIDTGQTE